MTGLVTEVCAGLRESHTARSSAESRLEGARATGAQQLLSSKQWGCPGTCGFCGRKSEPKQCVKEHADLTFFPLANTDRKQRQRELE